ncbi:site-specific integrase [Clostridium manihotivorum]|uniref:Site-specific integrase n=2 Tax=Clostridium manihotivorum TaxID=2320868 RepID=A0A410E1S8_9CLOT|nr:site-specific integrase [Clostridium manihotivorum]
MFLNKIKPTNINKLYLHCINDLGNSSTTVRQYHWILSKAFKDALKWKIIEYNIMDSIEPPKKVKKELTVYDKDQLFKLLDRIKHMTVYMPVLISSTTGMRLGEVCGLRWKDVDLDNKVIYVTRQLQEVKGKLELLELKTSTSKRAIPIIEDTRRALEDLKDICEYNKSNHANYHKEGFVICKGDGTPYDPEYVSRNYRRVMKQYKVCTDLNIPYIRFHDLRHTYATLMLEAGVNPKIVSGLLGHNTVGMTLNTYSHRLPRFDETAVSKLEDLLSPAKNDSPQNSPQN